MIMRVRVMVLDPQPIVREGVAAVLRDSTEFQVVGECADLRSALLMVDRCHPDVVVTDFDLGPREGGSAILELRRHLGAGGVVVFTGLPSWRAIGRARQAGARSVLLKTDPVETLAEAIRVTARGGAFLSASLPTELRNGVDRAPNVLGVLSDREREVFHLVVRGLTNRRIGRELFISPKTVDSHRGRILDKLGCRSAVELVRFAYVNGLIASPELAAPAIEPGPPSTGTAETPCHAAAQ
jgi:two-component system, NarL family, response regulator NreC